MKGLARVFGWLEHFLITAPPLYVGLGIGVAGLLGFLGMVTYNQSSFFCLKCHAPAGVFVSFAEDSTSHSPYKKDKERCLTCHTDKDFYRVAGKWVSRSVADFDDATGAETTRLPDPEPGYTDDECLRCHFDILKRDEADKLKLPEKVAKIGLRFSHRNHFWMKDYPRPARAQLERLRAMALPTEEQKTERDFLLRAQLGWCGQCHDREQPTADGKTRPDRSINYFSINPMRCIGCHPDATARRHPGTIHLALPREEQCRRCHSGTFHGRFAVFRAECAGEDKRDCRRCHPGWQPEAAEESGVAGPVAAAPAPEG
ncbi:MAG: hypothetical protein GX444_16505 [Myxococcales bacterium]|nr:hypothetical protein [Myxococcales bacterium]